MVKTVDSELSEIFELVSSRRLPLRRVERFLEEQDSLFQLYSIIRKQGVPDDELCSHLLAEQGVKCSVNSVRVLKSRLRDELVNFVCHLGFDKRTVSDRLYARYQLASSFVGGVLFERLLKSSTAIRLLSEAREHAIELEDSGLVAHSSGILSHLYFSEANSEEAQRFHNDAVLWQQRWMRDLEVQRMNGMLNLIVTRGTVIDSRDATEIRAIIKQAKAIEDQGDMRPMFRFDLTRVLCYANQALANYHVADALAHACVEYLLSLQSNMYHVKIGTLVRFRFVLQLEQRNYKLCRELIPMCEHYKEQNGTQARGIFLFNHCMLNIREERWQEAAEIYFEVVDGSYFKAMITFRVNLWNIVFMSLYVATLRTPLSFEESTLARIRSDFKLNTVASDLSAMSHDKQGINATFYIFQFVLLLLSKNYDGALSRFDALRLYKNRHFTDAKKSRLYSMLTILTTLLSVDFDVERVERKCAPHIKRIYDTGVAQGKVEHEPEFEFISYERLWEYIKESIGKNKKL